MLPAAYLRKSFALDKPLRRAVLFASALGVYELQLNGQPLNAAAGRPARRCRPAAGSQKIPLR